MSDPIPDADLAAMRDRVEAATPGPWWAEYFESLDGSYGGVWYVEYGDPLNKSDAFDLLEDPTEATVRFVAAVREDVPRLLAEIDRLKRGDFTPEEFQFLCHHRDERPGCTEADFGAGCVEFQRKLFGRAYDPGTP